MVDSLIGVDDQPVVQVSSNGLVAAVSRITKEELTPDVPLVMAYKKVIAAFHRERTVIPMRYGCLLEEKKQVVQLLKKNQEQYEALLKKLDGCVEMGIRVLIADCGLQKSNPKSAKQTADKSEIRNPKSPIPNPKSEIRNPKSAIPNPKSPMLGRTYLTSRKAHYEQEDNLGKEIDTIIEQYRKAFSGLYVKFKAEYASIGNLQSSIFNHQSQPPNPLLSLYFLVPRQSVERFRRVFRHICSGQDAKVLLSGPWPPYNFVTHCSG